MAAAVDASAEGPRSGEPSAPASRDGPIESSIDELTDGIAVFGDDLVLVLDDVQTVTDPDLSRSASIAILCVPPNGRLLAITRIDPALRLRTCGSAAISPSCPRDRPRVHLPGGAQTSSSAKRPRPLARRVRSCCTSERRAGRRRCFLATLWLRAVDDPASARADFGGDHRFVAEYLSREVHRVTRICPRAPSCSGPRCSAGSPPSSAMPRWIAPTRRRSWRSSTARNLFVVARAWRLVRVHPLFAEFARFRLASTTPAPFRDPSTRCAGGSSRGVSPVEATSMPRATGRRRARRRPPGRGPPGPDQGWSRPHAPSAGCGRSPTRPPSARPDAHGRGGDRHDDDRPVAPERRRLLRLADRARSEVPGALRPLR